jgi:Family of unknown function (DUF6461)/Transposase domain (DUF772)
VTATAADYLWFAERYPDLAEAFCLTLARDVAPAEVLHRMGTRETTELTGVGEVCRHYFTSVTPRGYPSLLVAATIMDGWTLAVEPNGFLGVTDEIVATLSRGTKVVSLFRNVNALTRFCWAEDGKVRLSFAPLFPTWREGSDAHGLVDVMRQVGFDLREGLDRDWEQHIGAAFALMEHVTGVRLTPEGLDSASYLCGTAPQLPGARLDQIIATSHPLVRLAKAINWRFLEEQFGAVYMDGAGRPPLPTRLVAGLAILKHMYKLSDEAVCALWLENPHYQYFCGEESFQLELPLDRSSMTNWRNRIGEARLQALLQESLAVATRTAL